MLHFKPLVSVNAKRVLSYACAAALLALLLACGSGMNSDANNGDGGGSNNPPPPPPPPSLLARLSTDPYTNTASQHATEVEPSIAASGSTLVSVFQMGRFFNGGASNIGFATSTDGGASWTSGSLPGTTIFASGTYAAISDPAVAYDRAHATWLISSLAVLSSNDAVVVSR